MIAGLMRVLVVSLFVTLAGCAGPPPESEPVAESVATVTKAVRTPGPFVRVVGTAQDGGLPHISCTGPRCERARADETYRRLVASLAIVLPESGDVYLIDATPDVATQLERLQDVRGPAVGRVDRQPLAGIFLTHAHIGHYLGLALFGFEAVHTQEMPVYGTERMLDYLRTNGPWNLLVERRNVDLRKLAPGGSVDLGEGVSVQTVAVPHRDEYTDTVGFRIAGPRSTIFYVPDTDSWNAWEPSIEAVLAEVDVGLLDGTFFSEEELPGRSVESIGHPLISTSLERLAPLVTGGTRIAFTHFNHSNPILDPTSLAAERVVELGFELLADGEELPL